jgi:hypothetical protein
MNNILQAFLAGVMLLCPSLIFAEEGKWNEYKSAHFSVYYKDIPLSFVKTVADSAEDSYGEISSSLGFNREQGWMSEKRAKIYIYQDDKDYVRNANQYQWSHGAASVQEKTIRTFPQAHGFFDSTLPHELGHIIFHEYIGHDVEIPLWFEEGVAMYQEKAKRFGVNADVRKALKNDQFISLTDLGNVRLYSDTPSEEVQLFYAESASIVYFMISELGESRFVKLCRELRSGKSFAEAMNAAYVRFSSLDDLNRAWVNYLKERQ